MHMSRMGLSGVALTLWFASVCGAATLTDCAQGARTFLPCELAFEYKTSELAAGSAYQDELLNVEFRSPSHTTYLMREFASGAGALRVRFTPTETGAWGYKVTSRIARYDNKEGNFNVTASEQPGLVSVANLRHWRTTNKKPHLWLAVGAPFTELEQPAFESFLEARKHDGFTHVSGILLSGSALRGNLEPDEAYFAKLDERILAAIARGFTVDLALADAALVRAGRFENRDQLDPLLRYVVARYGGLNVTWQGIDNFDDVKGGRSLLKDIGALLKKYDAFQHPRSTLARVSSSPLLSDGWMNYLIESAPQPQFGAVEHQFTEQPEIHRITAIDPDKFRHELWTATTSGEYPSVSYESMRNEANVKAVATWFKVISDTRHWELEPYFDVDGARAAGLEEVEYLAYAEKPGTVEVTLPKHKYNPVWVNPISGEEIPLKDYKGEVLSRSTPDQAHDWVLSVPRDGHKESMLRSYYFESQDPPVQEVESDPAKVPFAIVDPAGEELSARVPAPYSVKITRANRASRTMQYVWWGEVVGAGDGARVLGIGASGTLGLPAEAAGGSSLNLRVQAINANGKALEVDKVYRLLP
jgi:hypothetical protein